MNRKVTYGLLLMGVIILIGFALKWDITHEKFDSEKWKNRTETESKLSERWEKKNS